jgi:hypothetical protein
MQRWVPGKRLGHHRYSGLPALEPVATAREASGARRSPSPSSPEWEVRAVVTPRRHGPSLLEARAWALAVEVAGRRGSWTRRHGSWTWRLVAARRGPPTGRARGARSPLWPVGRPPPSTGPGASTPPPGAPPP